MKLDLKVYNKDDFDCFQNTVYTIASTWERDFILMYIDMWDLSFAKDAEKTFGESIRPYQNLELQKNLLYHGLYTEKKERTEISLLDIQTQTSDEKIFVAVLDAFYCPWYFGFQNKHRDHLCIILAITEDSVQLLDTFYTFRVEQLPAGELLKSLKNILIFEKREVLTNSLNYLDLLCNSLERKRNRENCMFTAFERLAAEIESSFDIKKEIYGDENIESVEFIFQLKVIAIYRKNFAQCLEYIAAQTGIDFTPYITQLNDIYERWIVLRMLVIKATLKAAKDLNKKLAGIISEIYQAEKSLSDDLYRYVKSIQKGGDE